MVKYEYNGIKGLTKIAIHLGVSNFILGSRLKKHHGNINLAVRDVKAENRKPQCEHEYNGIKGLENIARETGVSRSSIEKRIYDKGMTIKEAVEYKKKSQYEYNGVSGLRELSKKYGISPSRIQSRVTSGMTLEQALLTPVRIYNNTPNFKYEYNGIKGLKNISDRYDVSLNALSLLVREGLSIEDAIYKITKRNQKRVVSKIEKAKEDREMKKKERVNKKVQKCTNPDLLSNSWRLALGMSHA